MEEQSWEWEQLAFCLAFFVGLFQIVMGLLRVGFVVNFISEAVIVGFTTGAAFLISATQARTINRYFVRFIPLYDVYWVRTVCKPAGHAKVLQRRQRQLHVRGGGH